ncbi:kinase binding protein CGI-121-domain-containing protein [Favolaschia claudopus]|uniref:EKC/KEOPS complex subunit CGI121 n=1 Tax=Favolaschia claudopus TaxID=2862362 RepID=A0AAW0B540_9AGAR
MAEGSDGERERDAVNFAFIEARLITSVNHLRTAIYHAVLAESQNNLRTKTVHSEIIWALNPSNNIAAAMRRPGYGCPPSHSTNGTYHEHASVESTSLLASTPPTLYFSTAPSPRPQLPLICQRSDLDSQFPTRTANIRLILINSLLSSYLSAPTPSLPHSTGQSDLLSA